MTGKGAWLTLTVGERAGKTVCTHCHMQRVNEGDPDPCLGLLPGVANACCGHGFELGYLIFENGRMLYFDARSAGQVVGPSTFDSVSCDAFTEKGGKLEIEKLVPADSKTWPAPKRNKRRRKAAKG